MKKFLAIFLALLMCLGVLASCGGGNNTDAATLDEAKELLDSMMKDKNGKVLANDYDVPAKLVIGDSEFEITWKTDNKDIKIKESSKKGFWTVDLPNVNEKEVEYKLTATIKNADGETIETTFTPKLAAVKNENLETDFKADVEYKAYIKQANLGYDVYVLNTTQNDENKFINTTMDPKEAAVFKFEIVEGGYKIYTDINGVKNYLHATATPKADNPDKFTKTIGFATSTDCVFTYDSALSLFKIKLSGIEFGVGTYGTYDTVSLSESKYFKADNINVKEGQFPLSFMTKENADKLTPSVKPENTDPKADTTLSIADAIALGNTKVKDQYTEGKYYIEGTVKEIQSDVYGNLVITDGTNDLLIYGTYSEDGKTRFDKLATKPAVGDKIKVYGVIGKYNDAQMKNGWIVGAVAGENAGGNTGDNTDIPAGKNYINMVVSGTHVNGAYEKDAKTVYTLDATLKTIIAAITGTTDASKDGNYAFGTRNDKTFLTMGPVYADAEKSFIAQFYSGASVVDAPVAGTAYKLGMVQTAAGKTVYLAGGMDGYYMATTEDASKAIDVYLEATTGGYYLYTGEASNEGGTETPENPGTEPENPGTTTPEIVYEECTITEALAKDDNAAVKVSGIVTVVNYKWSDSNNNMSVTISDANGNTIYAYKLASKVELGDYITISGKMGTYNGRQIAQGATAEIGTADDAHKAAFEASQVTLDPTEYNQATVDVDLPASSNVKYEAALTWTQNGTAATKLTATQTAEDQTITLVVTATVGEATATKTIEVKVLAAGTDYTCTIPEALAKEDGEKVIVSGIVTKVNYAWSDSNNNMSVTITDANGDFIYAFKLATKVELGDYITISGEMGTYNGRQIAQGATAEIGTADDAHKAVFALSQVSIETEYNADVNVTLPTTSADATLTWKNGEDTITNLTATQTEAKQTITLTVTATVGEATATKTIEVTVSAKPAEGTTTVTVTIADIATANSWENGSTQSSITVDENITASATGAKYYSSDNTWRLYESSNVTMTISAAEGKTIVSVKITYKVKNSGTLTLTTGENTNNIASNTLVDVNASSITFGVSNTSGSGNNGQAQVTAIEVVYK